MRASVPPLVASGGLVLRLPATDDAWVLTLPPVPSGPTVTVSINGDLRPGEGAVLARRGYELVGVLATAPPGSRTADVLVPAELRADERWFRAVLSTAGRVFDPELGPVRLVLEPVLRLHASGGA